MASVMGSRATRGLRTSVAGVAVWAAVLSFGDDARAIGAIEVPDNGAQQFGRGGAWVARAATPLATFYNPAALSGLETGVTLGTNINFYELCTTRTDENGDPEQPELGGVAGLQGGVDYPETCNEDSYSPQPIPHAAFNWRVTKDLGIGFGIVPPAALGTLQFPETVKSTTVNGTAEFEIPSPQRYQLLSVEGLIANFVISGGYNLGSGFRVGVGFLWGFADMKLASAAMALPSATQTQDNIGGDVKAELEAQDLFIPGAVFGILYSPMPELDIGFHAQIQDKIDASGDLKATSLYWDSGGNGLNPSGGVTRDSSDLEDDLITFRQPNPMTFRVGAAYRMPRDGAPGYYASDARRDPIAEDIFDVEIDLEYTLNSAYDRIEIRTPESPEITLFTDESGQEAGRIPEEADIPLNLQNTWGVRVGGDYVVVPDTFAARLGFWYQSAAADDNQAYIGPLPVAGWHAGVAIGGQVRIVGFDLELGVMRMFNEKLKNDGKCLIAENGIQSCDGRGEFQALTGNVSSNNRSPYSVNGGTVSLDAWLTSVSVSKRFE